jgi:hypothetical protein
MRRRRGVAARWVLIFAAVLLLGGFLTAAGGAAQPTSAPILYASVKDADRLPPGSPPIGEEVPGGSLLWIAVALLADILIIGFVADYFYRRGRASVKPPPPKTTVQARVNAAAQNRINEAILHNQTTAQALLVRAQADILAELQALDLA